MTQTRRVRFGIIADDLTGACDAGVQFARRGFTTVVPLDAGRPGESAEVMVLSTNSRADSAATARRKVRQACRFFRDRNARVIFKKIDSTLRGNVPAEIQAAMQATGRRSAVLAPAFPAMGRIVLDGRLHVAGRAPQAIAAGAGIVVADARTQSDLARLAKEALGARPAPLLAGSAGLAMELARLLASEYGKKPRAIKAPPPRSGPLLVFVGSTNPVTASQVATLEQQRAKALAQRLVRIVAVRRAGADPRASTNYIRELLTPSPAGVFVTGGDTALVVFRALGVEAIRLENEILPGIPWGRLAGGLVDGLPVVTKAGGFGREDALVRIVDFLAPDCATVEV